jgi:hypothetical protein
MRKFTSLTMLAVLAWYMARYVPLVASAIWALLVLQAVAYVWESVLRLQQGQRELLLPLCGITLVVAALTQADLAAMLIAGVLLAVTLPLGARLMRPQRPGVDQGGGVVARRRVTSAPRVGGLPHDEPDDERSP